VAQAYSAETKAAALADLATGASVNGTARKYGVDRSTVKRWRDASGIVAAPVPPQKQQADLGEQLYGYLEDSIGALRAQLAVFGDPDWLKKQSAADVAILHGVVADKTARLLAAVRPADPPDGAIDAAATPAEPD
jgi:hypothetical protein